MILHILVLILVPEADRLTQLHLELLKLLLEGIDIIVLKEVFVLHLALLLHLFNLEVLLLRVRPLRTDLLDDRNVNVFILVLSFHLSIVHEGRS